MSQDHPNVNQFQSPVVLVVIQDLFVGILLPPETPTPQSRALVQMVRVQAGVPGM